MPMALVGIGRAFEIDLTPYLSPYGARVLHEMQTASIINVLGQYPGLKWEDLVSPDSREPAALRPLRQQADHGHRRYADDPAVQRPGRQR